MTAIKTASLNTSRYTVAARFGDTAVVMSLSVAYLGIKAVELATSALTLFDDFCREGYLPGKHDVGIIEIEHQSVLFEISRGSRAASMMVPRPMRTIYLALIDELSSAEPPTPRANA